jgi:hypothetical protein
MATTIAPICIKTNINTIWVQLPQFSPLKKNYFFGKKKAKIIKPKESKRSLEDIHNVQTTPSHQI